MCVSIMKISAYFFFSFAKSACNLACQRWFYHVSGYSRHVVEVRDGYISQGSMTKKALWNYKV